MKKLPSILAALAVLAILCAALPAGAEAAVPVTGTWILSQTYHDGRPLGTVSARIRLNDDGTYDSASIDDELAFTPGTYSCASGGITLTAGDTHMYGFVIGDLMALTSEKQEDRDDSGRDRILWVFFHEGSALERARFAGSSDPGLLPGRWTIFGDETSCLLGYTFSADGTVIPHSLFGSSAPQSWTAADGVLTLEDGTSFRFAINGDILILFMESGVSCTFVRS